MKKTLETKNLLDFLKQTPKNPLKAAVLPDYFMDRIVSLPWNPEEFSQKIQQVSKRSGGSLDGIPQTDLAGGNAVNVASALECLGAQVTPIVCTSTKGLQQIQYHFKNRPIDYSHVKTSGAASVTTALEFKHPGGKANVMVRDLGALAAFGPSDLSEADFELIGKSDFVCLFNWAGTLNYGTALAETVFGAAKKAGCRTYYDTADPNPNAAQIPELIRRVLKTCLVDVLSLNENEAVTYASSLNPDFTKVHAGLGFADLALKAARLLAQNFSCRVDLHTTSFSATVRRSGETVVPAFKVEVQRATGAGDAWCAGNIYGDHNGLSDPDRLTLANAVAACYLKSHAGTHPSTEAVEVFLRRQQSSF